MVPVAIPQFVECPWRVAIADDQFVEHFQSVADTMSQHPAHRIDVEVGSYANRQVVPPLAGLNVAATLCLAEGMVDPAAHALP